VYRDPLSPAQHTHTQFYMPVSHTDRPTEESTHFLFPTERKFCGDSRKNVGYFPKETCLMLNLSTDASSNICRFFIHSLIAQYSAIIFFFRKSPLFTAQNDRINILINIFTFLCDVHRYDYS
jgi:hypothetical protein